MVDTNALRGELAKKGISQAKMANLLGITPKTFYAKMNKKVFDSDEIEVMVKTLSIKDPVAIFFASKIT